MKHFHKHLSKHIKAQCFPKPKLKPITLEAFESITHRYSLSSFLTYHYLDKEGLWLADNPSGMDSFLFGLEILPIIIAGDKTTEKVQSILEALPTGSVVHSIAHASSNLYAHLESWASARQCGQNSHDIYTTMTQRRAKYFIDWSQGKLSGIKGDRFKPRAIHYYWFVRIPAPYQDYSKEHRHTLKKKIDHLKDLIQSELQGCRIISRALSGKTIVYLLKHFIQSYRDYLDIQEDNLSENKPLADQLFSPQMNLQVDESGILKVSDTVTQQQAYLRTLSATQFPNTPFFMAAMADCIGSVQRSCDFIESDFYAYTIIEILNRDKTKFQAGKKMALLQYQTASRQEFWQQIMRPLYKRKHHVQELYDAIDKQGETPVKIWTGMTLMSKSLACLEESTGVCQSLWKSLGFDLHVETAISLPAWIATLPGQYRSDIDKADQGLQRGTTMKASNAACLTHLQGDWKGSLSKKGGLLAISRRGALTTLNLFDTYKSNYNAVMAAASGSGKSFMVNDIALDFLARGGSVRIIDAGRSYYNTAEALGGCNLVFEKEKQLCMNPFSAIKSLQDLQEDMETLVSLVTQMAFPFGPENSIKGSDAYEYRAIEAAIEYLWKSKKDLTSVSDIADYFLAKEEEKLRKIGQQLRPWASGRYAKWMTGKSNISFNNPFIVLELDELSDQPELQGIVLNLILAKLAREMYLSSQQELIKYGHRLPKLIVIDEAWDLLSKPNTGAFIEKAYRRARKYYCAMMIVTQSFTDCDKTSAAKTALANANWIITLMHDLGALKQAIDTHLLNLNPYAKHMIESLQKTDQYSEFYIINKSVQGEGLYRLVVDPATYFMYTTDANERDQLNKLIKAGKSLDQAIAILSNKR